MSAPEVILEFHAGEPVDAAAQAQFKKDWDRMPSLPAVRDGRVYVITESYALRPGPRVADVAALLAQLLHPDAKIPSS